MIIASKEPASPDRTHSARRISGTHACMDGATVAGDGNVSQAVDEHLVHALWTQGAFHGLRYDLGRHNVRVLGFSPLDLLAPSFNMRTGTPASSGAAI